MVCARMGCPLLVGLGEGENFIASDVSAILQATRRVIFLEEGDTAEVTREQVRVFDGDGAPVEREVHVSDVSLASLELGPYRHFMQKEIHEQPRAIRSEEHTSELQSLMRTSYAVFCLNKKKTDTLIKESNHHEPKQ